MEYGGVVAHSVSHKKNNLVNQMDRIYKLDVLLADGRSRTLEFLLTELEILVRHSSGTSVS